MTPLKAIRQNCLDCMNGNANEVKMCPMETKCPLWPYRFGHNPARAGLGKIGNLRPDMGKETAEEG